MTRTYVGPFGRILPASDDSDLSSSESDPRSADATSSSMAARSLFSTASLDFGSDPFNSFDQTQSRQTQMSAHSNNAYSRLSSTDSGKSVPHAHQLPPFSHLLAPTSHHNISTRPFSPTSGPASPSDVRTSVHQAFPGDRASHIRQPLNPSSPYPGLVHASQSGPPYVNSAGQHVYSTPSRQYHSPPANNLGPSLHSGQYQGPSHYEAFDQQPPRSMPPSFGAQYAQPAQHRPHGRTITNSKSHSGCETNVTVKPLPRVIREEMIPGEGPCWIYEDGSVVPKAINGEAVIPEWGVTKAGKPRKRLAIACSTCREKKIKCDPREPKCVQCEKSGRECRFTTA